MQTVETAVEPRVETLPAQPYLAQRVEASIALLSETIAGAVQLVAAEIARRGLAPCGPPLFRYRAIDMPERLALDVGFPVAGSVPESGENLIAEVLPAGRYVITEHQGPPASLVGANAALQAWAEAQGLTWDMTGGEVEELWGCRYEQQLVGPNETEDADAWVTRIVYRLAET